jgi:hypothetical protein
MVTIQATEEPKTFDLKMPKDYDFSTRGVNWKSYKPYYILRTDAVWEKSKLYQYFYTTYKSQKFFNKGHFHLISDVFMYYNIKHDPHKNFDYDEIGESKTHTPQAANFSKNGELFEWEIGATKEKVRRTSTFLGDQSKDMTTLCMIKFFKWMKCDEKSEVKMSLINRNEQPDLITKYDCFRELSELHEHCIRHHFKVLFDLYYLRAYSDYLKWPNNIVFQKFHTETNRPTKARVLYY